MKVLRLMYDPKSIHEKIGEILLHLDQHGVAIIGDIFDNENGSTFLDLAVNFGSLRPHSVLRGVHAKASPQDYIFDVAVRPEPMKTARGTDIKSHTSTSFYWHTDEAFLKLPADIILLHCVVVDPNGEGMSGLCHIDDVITRLSPDQLEHLSRPVFPHLTGKQPLIFNRKNRWYVRCNLNYLHQAADSLPIDKKVRCALSAFEAALNEAGQALLLRSGECLILDNWRTLHNRTAFRHDSPRLLRRLRIGRQRDWNPFTKVGETQA